MKIPDGPPGSMFAFWTVKQAHCKLEMPPEGEEVRVYKRSAESVIVVAKPRSHCWSPSQGDRSSDGFTKGREQCSGDMGMVLIPGK